MDRSNITKEISEPAQITDSEMNNAPAHKMTHGRDDSVASPKMPSYSGAIQASGNGPSCRGAVQDNGEKANPSVSGAVQKW